MQRAQIETSGIKLPLTVKIIISLVLFTHALYLLLFYAMGEEILATVNIFSILIYVFVLKLVYDSSANDRIAIALFQVEILLHASSCIVVLGWGYGFELLFLASTITMFFTMFSYQRTSYALITLQIITSIGLYIWLQGESIRPPDVWQSVLFVFNISLATIFSIVISYLLELSNAFIFLNILKQKENIKTIVNHDPLTGLLNRTSMQNIIDTPEIFENMKFSVVMCDIDDFKKINDTYGHGAGDAVLTSISQIFTDIFRKGDYVARWGGEEFLALLCNVTQEGAVSVINRIKDVLNENVVEYKNISITATMTFGVVSFDGKGKFDILQMIKQADELLYDGKRNGKNVVVSANFSPATRRD